MENQLDYVKKVQDSYLPHERTKLDELKELDKKVNTFPMVIAMTLGIIAALILGVGMCFAMQVIGTSIPPKTSMAAGVIIGCAGIALCVANYYIYKAILKSRKNKYASRILELSNQLLNK